MKLLTLGLITISIYGQTFDVNVRNLSVQGVTNFYGGVNSRGGFNVINSGFNVDGTSTLTTLSGSTVIFNPGTEFIINDEIELGTDITVNIGDSTHRLLGVHVGGGVNMYDGSTFTFYGGGGSFVGSVSNLSGAFRFVANSIFNFDSGIGAATFIGPGGIHITNTDLNIQGIRMDDASGTTTGNAIELNQFGGGTTYFKVVMGTDASHPGQVYTKNISPITNALYSLGTGAGDQWAGINVNVAIIYGTLDLSNMSGFLITPGGTAQSGTKTVRNGTNTGSCNLVFTLGLLTSSTC